MSDVRFLTVEDVLSIHEILVADFAHAGDPISPAGPRGMALVESAVGRQMTSLGGVLKYPEPIGNVATVAFGLCCDHPFHNGNKRTALVSLLVEPVGALATVICTAVAWEITAGYDLYAFVKTCYGDWPSSAPVPAPDTWAPVDEEEGGVRD
jgi:hypothetical protein